MVAHMALQHTVPLAPSPVSLQRKDPSTPLEARGDRAAARRPPEIVCTDPDLRRSHTAQAGPARSSRSITAFGTALAGLGIMPGADRLRSPATHRSVPSAARRSTSRSGNARQASSAACTVERPFLLRAQAKTSLIRLVVGDQLILERMLPEVSNRGPWRPVQPHPVSANSCGLRPATCWTTRSWRIRNTLSPVILKPVLTAESA
jgi:hypothetical protein